MSRSFAHTPLPETLACRAPYGRGGLGQHFAQAVEAARAAGRLDAYLTTAPRQGDAAGVRVPQGLARALIRYTPVRFDPARRHHVAGDLFDRAVAARLASCPGQFTGFVGKALHSFHRARRLGAQVLGLHVGNGHVRHVARRHAAARQRWGIESSWLGPATVRKALAEYDAADVVYVNSGYTWRTFVEAGVPEDRLALFRLRPDARFAPQPRPPDDGLFRIVYCGALTVAKGIPVLLEAFARLPVPGARLTLVGGWSTRAMRRYVERRMAADDRIRHCPGDPLPYLREAAVCVHPTYEDGFAYAPAEALACAVPVVVTEDTGMRELVRDGVDGYVVPTGDVDALVDRLVHLHRYGPVRLAPPPPSSLASTG